MVRGLLRPRGRSNASYSSTSSAAVGHRGIASSADACTESLIIFVQRCSNSGIVLLVQPISSSTISGTSEAQQGSGLGHPMIGVGVPQIAPEHARVDRQPVVGLPDMTAKPTQLGLERSQPIGLMAADVCHTSQMARVIGEGRYCGDDWCQLGGCIQIKIDSVDVVGALHSKVAAFQRHRGRQSAAGCRGSHRPAGSSRSASSGL